MDPRALRINDVTYELPEERIARFPLDDRDTSKLLVHDHGRIADHRFGELPSLLPANTTLVLNDTRVVHARLAFRRATGALIECMVLNPIAGRAIEQALQDQGTSRWWCMVGNAKRWKGEELRLDRDGGITATRIDQRDGEHLVEFRWTADVPFVSALALFGHMPLPPYMRRDAEATDQERYNTVFAQHDGSVAAPTASLHFTPAVMDGLRAAGVRTVPLTLHVGAGTFLPVKSNTMEGHAMHAEEVRIERSSIVALLERHGPIVAGGTTALRTLESLYWHGVDLLLGKAGETMDVTQWRPYDEPSAVALNGALRALLDHLDRCGSGSISGRTRLLIAPGYRFRVAEGLITNFHQPGSTLLLLVAAFVGDDWQRLYSHAIANEYRFLSYGDGSLLWRKG